MNTKKIIILSAIVIVIILGGIGILLLNTFGFVETTLEYVEKFENSDGTYTLIFKSPEYSEKLEFIVSSEEASRLTNYREYKTRRKENSDSIEYKIDMPGIITKNGRKYNLAFSRTLMTSVSNKELVTEITIDGGSKTKNKINFSYNKENYFGYVAEEFYSEVHIGSKIQITEITYENKEGNRVYKYVINQT